MDDQRVIWAQGYGLADVANQVPATADTLYRAGSISKLFTGAAVLTLAEQGKLDIDQPGGTYLPAIKPDATRAKAITLRQVLTHHAGLPRDQMQGMFLAEPTHFGEAVELLNREPLAYPPGQMFSYSNLGFIAWLGGAGLQRHGF
ncbi:MAG: beta-lactamase family protein [Betaproteobacteria bacterium]|nr:beta-lactamase family protein [Betaproteobacteria bacterium]